MRQLSPCTGLTLRGGTGQMARVSGGGATCSLCPFRQAAGCDHALTSENKPVAESQGDLARFFFHIWGSKFPPHLCITLTSSLNCNQQWLLGKKGLEYKPEPNDSCWRRLGMKTERLHRGFGQTLGPVRTHFPPTFLPSSFQGRMLLDYSCISLSARLKIGERRPISPRSH